MRAVECRAARYCPVSPTAQSDPYAGEEEYNYEIYSKIWDAAAQATLRQKGEEARRARMRPSFRDAPCGSISCANLAEFCCACSWLRRALLGLVACVLAGRPTRRNGRRQEAGTRRRS